MSDPHPLVEALRNRVGQLVSLVGGEDVTTIEEGLDEAGQDSVMDWMQTLAEENQELRSRVADLENQMEAMGDLGKDKSTKEQKVAALVQYAKNTADGRKAVLLKPKEVKGVAGVSRRYAYDMIDDLPETYDFLVDRSDAKQYGSLELDNNARGRGLIVDLEALHSDERLVNKFTTRNGGKEAQA